MTAAVREAPAKSAGRGLRTPRHRVRTIGPCGWWAAPAWVIGGAGTGPAVIAALAIIASRRAAS